MTALQQLVFADADHRKVYRYVERQGGAEPAAVQAALDLAPDRVRTILSTLRQSGYIEERDGILRVTLETGDAQTYTHDGMTVTLRPANQDDLTGLVEVMRQVSDEMVYGVAESVAEQLLYEDAVIRHNEARSRVFFVAAVGDEIVGWTHLESPRVEKLHHTAQQTVGVSEPYRGYGIGSRLLQRGMEWAATHNFQKVYNSVPATNEQAVAFLRSHGWEVEAIRDDHYRVDDKFIDEVMLAYQPTAPTADETAVEAGHDAATDTLVSSEWVEDRLDAFQADDPAYRLLEVNVDASHDYASHIPGAITVNWDVHLRDQTRRSIVPRETFEAVLGSYGITQDSTVVLYGDHSNRLAAYAYWLFTYYGHDDIRLLDGGREYWIANEYPLTAERQPHPGTTYTAGGPVTRIRASRDDVETAVRRDLPLVDVRSPEAFAGTVPVESDLEQQVQRSGHIPGATNIPWAKTVVDDGTFTSRTELAELYRAESISPEQRVIVYGRIAEHAAHTWFVLQELLGYDDVAVYDGSWIEWSHLVDTPIESGDTSRAPDLTVDQIFDVLATTRRREILEYLAHHNEIASLDALILQIARQENDTSETHRDRVRTDLLHRQLPKLEDMELVRYEPAHGLVALRDPPTPLLVYLSLATE